MVITRGLEGEVYLFFSCKLRMIAIDILKYFQEFGEEEGEVA